MTPALSDEATLFCRQSQNWILSLGVLATGAPVESSAGQQILSDGVAALITTLPLPTKYRVTKCPTLQSLPF